MVGASNMVSTIEATASFTHFLVFGLGASKMVSTIEAAASSTHLYFCLVIKAR